MRVLVQKCLKGSVSIEGNTFSEIEKGFVLFVGFTEGDNVEKIEYMAKKVANLRIFEDENGVMNKSILEESGSVLSISQFTLYADTQKGNRPSYIAALNGSISSPLYDKFNEELAKYLPVKTGIFGSDMKVTIINAGPTTILLER